MGIDISKLSFMQISKLILAIGVSATLVSFIFSTDNIIKAREIEQDFVGVKQPLHISKYEVSNRAYKEFMAFLNKTEQKDLYRKCLWDTAKWLLTSGNEPMKTYYHSHKSYDNYPVVTISYDAAIEYCNWLTAQYNSDRKRKFRKVVFRLPSEEEWTLAASGGRKEKMYPWDNYYLRNKNGEYLCNFRHFGDQSITFDKKTNSYKVVETFADRPALPSPINSYYAAPSGFHNLSGNAAEMVLEKGLAKGGSFNDPGYDVSISSKKYYDHPSSEIGFRVAMEIVEN